MTTNLSQMTEKKDAKKNKPMCGIVMPISPIDGLTAEHFFEVKGLIVDVAASEGFSSRIVSTGDESGIIQQRIIQNLYSDEIIVCDVSGKNPNVMFELGIRLAFDKPTIIIKDDKTDYSFDTAVIEHIEYPRDLRFNQIVTFKNTLAAKISATFEKSKDKGYSTFLKHFGTFKAKELEEKEGGMDELLLLTMEEIKADLNSLKRSSSYGISNTERRMTMAQKADSSYYKNILSGVIRDFISKKRIPASEILTDETIRTEFLGISSEFLYRQNIKMPLHELNDFLDNIIFHFDQN